MSEALIVRRGGSGSGSFAATLTVSTSAGAAVSASSTSSGKTYSGTAGSNGVCTLTIKAPGTYSVTSTLDGKSTSKSIVIADKGASYSLTVAHVYYLYNRGTSTVTFTTGEGGYKQGSTTIGSSNISIAIMSTYELASDTQFVYSGTLDLSEYSTLAFDYEGVTTDNFKVAKMVGGVSTTATPTVSWENGAISDALAQNSVSIASNASGLSGTVSVNIASVSSGKVVCGMATHSVGVSGTQTASAKITAIYLM